MPRGKPGTGPHARKRIQAQFQTPETEYLRLPLSEDETRALYTALQETLKVSFGTQLGFHLSNVTYRITEYVMQDKMGLPRKEPPQPADAPNGRRGGRAKKGGRK